MTQNKVQQPRSAKQYVTQGIYCMCLTDVFLDNNRLLRWNIFYHALNTKKNLLKAQFLVPCPCFIITIMKISLQCPPDADTNEDSGVSFYRCTNHYHKGKCTLPAQN